MDGMRGRLNSSQNKWVDKAIDALQDANLLDDTINGMKGSGQALSGALQTIGKNLGAIVGAAQLISELNKDGVNGQGPTVNDIAKAALGVGVGILAGALLPATIAGVAAAAAVGLAAGWLYDQFAGDIISPDLANASYWDVLFDLLTGGNVSGVVNKDFGDAKGWRQPVDPLMLDLDGDGLELKAADGSILFDHDADGVKTGTGWLGSDDGLLVRDLDGNGLIQTGRELFGVDTIKRNGEKAANAFDALADLDSNADGNFTSADLAWGQVKVWRDIDQDGVSDAGELFSLDQLGISRIGVVGSATNTTGGSQAGTTINGNFIAQSASFTRNDQTLSVGSASLSAGAIDLDSSNFHRQFTDHIPLTDIAKALPTMQGSGRVRDLAEAVSLSPELAVALTAFSSATTREAQMALIDNLITTWAKSSDFWSSIEDNLGGKDNLSLGITLTGGMTQEQFRNLIGVLEVFNGERFYEKPSTTETVQIVAGFTSSTSTTTSGGVTIVRPGYLINPPAAQLALLQQSYESLKESIYGALVMQTRLKPYLDSIGLTINENGVIGFNLTALTAKLDGLKASNERAALVDLVELNRYAQNALLAAGFNGMERLRSWIGSLPTDSALRTELASLNVYAETSTTGSTKDDIYVGNSAGNNFSGGTGNDTLDGGAGNDNLTGGDGADTLIGGDGNDYLYGSNGNDTLLGGAGSDYLYGEAGNDILDGGAGNDSLSGGDGSDTYRFARGWGQDSISNYDTSAGKTDAIEFAAGISASDIVATRSGDSLVLSLKGTNDTITVSSYFSADGTSGYKLEQIRFADGTAWDVAAVKALVQQSTSGNDTLYGYATADTLSGGAGNDTINGYAGDDTLDGGAGNDNLTGGDGADTLIGGDGNDYLYGSNGNDTLLGGAGSDYLYGEAGNDILDGGAGNDSLSGGDGSDTYRFARGWGQDSISNYDTSAGKTDAIEFAAGISASDIVATRSGDSLVLSLKGTNDTITVSSYFSADGTSGYKLEQIRFADGTAWDYATTKSKVVTIGSPAGTTLQGTAADETLSGSAGNDTLNGGYGADLLQGGDGNDTLNGEAGNDTLDGGAGNDALNGGAGNDTYLFGRGSGRDTVYDYDTTAGNIDTVQFGEGVSASDVLLWRSGDSLYLYIDGFNGDRLELQNYFYQEGVSAYSIENIRFADGTSWDLATIKSKVVVPTEGNDSLIGYAGNDTLSGLAGDDIIYGRAGDDTIDGGAGADTLYGEDGNDTLFGGAQDDTLNGGYGADLLQGGDGNDTLNGEAGNDTLDGGAGNDTLNGGAGNDTYLFGRGSGRDTVYDYDTTSGNIDTVQFGEGVSASDVLLWRSGDSLYLYIDGFNGDRLELQNYFYQEGVSAYSIENIRFADGTSWDLATIKSKVVVPTEGNDSLIGYAGNDTLSGLAGDDIIYGRAGDDTIDGGAGADTLYGEDGNDTLFGGAQDDTLNGGYGADLLQGGDGNDTLNGEAGNDTLDGGAGNDTLNGGAGNDTYLFGRGSGRDTVYDYDTTSGNIDIARFGVNVSADQLWFSRSGSDLSIDIIGTDNRLTISNWYASSSYRIEQFKTADGKTLLDSRVQSLVDAMAAFSPPAAGQTTLPNTHQSGLNSVIAANWQ